MTQTTQKIIRWILPAVAALGLLACDQQDTTGPSSNTDVIAGTKASDNGSTAPPTDAEAITAQSFKTVEWPDLMPEDDLMALLNPPSYVTEVEDGSFEDQISSQIQTTLAAAGDDRYQQALSSTAIMPALDGQAIRIPGFIVPLEFDDNNGITQFFLVPFFGACIHVPPPPPNQMIFVNYPKGLQLDALHDPFWISGILRTSLMENDMATAAYSMQMASFAPYAP